MFLLFLIIYFPFLAFVISYFLSFFIGKKGSALLTSFFILLSLVATLVTIFYKLKTSINSIFYIELSNYWIVCKTFKIQWIFLFDNLSLCMLVVILSISFLVHVYSINYMGADPKFSKFMSFLSLFTFFMIILVTSSNFITLFLGWEGVGLCSFLLISFWSSRIQAVKSAIKAMFVNRIGDFFILVAVSLIFYTFKSIDFLTVFSISNYIYNSSPIIFYKYNIVDLICIFLLLGAMAKSAQIGLHSWLPDAMEGPTPVSALIHAATMVTAGVFLIIRCSFLFENSLISLNLMVYVGSITLVLFGLVGLAQYDIKKIIAYSTCSQLGYMFLACGLSSYNLALFHLFNHAFFKALLFLAAGSFIHSLNGEQDIRRMGGLSKILPFTFSVFFIASLSLGGFPFFSGFYSKELIINNAFFYNNTFVYIFSIIGVCLTALYSFKLIFYLAINPSQFFKKNLYFSESVSIFNMFPLFILSLASIFSGFYFKVYFTNLESNFFNNSIYFLTNNNLISYFLPLEIKLIPLLALICSVIAAIIIYTSFTFRIWYLNNFSYLVFFFTFFNKRLFFDDLVNFFIFYFYKTSYIIYNTLDKGFLESFGPKNLSKILALTYTSFVKFFHKGIIDRYSIIFFINILVIIIASVYIFFY